jgi:hypothetical protein
MPNYGYEIGRGYQSAGEDIAKGLTIAIARSKKQHDTAEAVQGILDIARRMQYPDQKSGKVTNFFKDDQLQYIQRLIDQKKYHAAGQAEAAMGMGKDMYGRIQIAAAKQAAAAEKAQQIQKQMQQGPIMATTPQGERAMYNPHTGTWGPPPSLPRDSSGQTTTEQQNFQKAMSAQQAAQANTQRAGFNVLLKSMNVSPQDLYDTTKATPGVLVPDRGFFATADYMPAQAEKSGGRTIGADPAQLPPDPTHVRLGYVPPSKELFARGDKKNLPVKPGNPGHVITMDEFNALRDAQAQLAGPTADQAWKWMNTSPEATQTDYNGNPWTEESIDQYKKLLPGVRKQFQKQIAEGFEIPKQEVTTTTAPAQAPAAAFPITKEPVTTVPDEPVVSEDAADQNEGY